jgi:hypothetical protein
MNYCQNYNMCGSKACSFFTDSSSCILCYNTVKEKLKEFPNTECSICLKNTLCFKNQKCNHNICSNCYKITVLKYYTEDFLNENLGKRPIEEDNNEYMNKYNNLIEKIKNYKCLHCNK